MELELERKLITLENSVRDIDERLAELYRETASLSLQRTSVLRDLARSAAASRKRAEDVKKIHGELKTGLGDVSEKLARMDAVTAQLDSMRRAARREKSKEFAGLAESVLALNGRVSKLSRAVEGLRTGEPPELAPVVSRMGTLEKELRSKAPMDAFKRDLEELRSALARLESASRGNGKLEDLRKDMLKSIDDLDMKLKCHFDEKMEVHRESLENKLSEKTAEIARLSQTHGDITKSVSALEKQVKGLQGAVSAFSGVKARDIPSFDVSRVKELEKKVEGIRDRTNTVLKEIYDMVDSLKAANTDAKNRLGEMDKRITAMPKISAGGEVDLSGMLSSIEELRENVSTLAKGIEISRVIAEEVKRTQDGLSRVEEWRSRTEHLPKEMERLAERLSCLEAAKTAPVSTTDINNLKLAVAELANKNRLINELALENQKMQNKLFVLEGRLNVQKEAKDN